MPRCYSWCGCRCRQSTEDSERQRQDLQLRELRPEIMKTITKQPDSRRSSHNRSSNARHSEQPSGIRSWSCDEAIDQYNVDDFETRTPTMWRAWWLQGASEQLPPVIPN